MENLFPDTKNYRFFKELGQVLSAQKCADPECADKEGQMYLLYYRNAADAIDFNVVKSKVCCPAFESQLRKTADDLRKDYENDKNK